MDTINVSILRNNLAEVIGEVENAKKFFIIKSRGKISSVLVNLDYFEDLLAASDDEYLQSIREARLEAKNKQTLTLDEAFGEL